MFLLIHLDFLFEINLSLKKSMDFSKLEGSKNMGSKLTKNKFSQSTWIVIEIIDYKFIIYYMDTFNWLLKIYVEIETQK